MINDEYIYFFYIKVCITDINEECGQRAETELQKQCPRGQILFLKCDVTAQDEFEGLCYSALLLTCTCTCFIADDVMKLGSSVGAFNGMSLYMTLKLNIDTFGMLY